MIQIRWEILQQEGRSIKALADIAHIKCKFLPKLHQCYSNEKGLTNCISQFKHIQKLSHTQKELAKYFGNSSNEKQQITKLLNIYENEIKIKMKIPVLQYYKNYQPPLPSQLLSQKYQQIQEGLTKIRQLFKNRTSVFICGEKVTAIDILVYFDVCNLFYFGKNHTIYPQIKEWFQSLYKIRPIRTITHQWFSMARQILRSMRPRKVRANI